MIHKSTFFLLLGSLILFNSCKDTVVDNPIGNKAPTTKVFLTPDSTISKQKSKIKLYWTGDDPDGVVVGFYFSWDGVNWSFTTGNDSLFTLQIGAVDAVYNFQVAAVDNGGNGQYDTLVSQNGIHYGHEPFTDLNGDGKWESGEPYTDIGLISPAVSLKVPITNTAPVISWNILSTVPDTTFPVMSFGWNISDIDGDESIAGVRVALNDTNNYVTIDGTIRNITIRTSDYTSTAKMDILIDGNSSSIASAKLPGILFDNTNVLYVQAVDIGGSASSWITTKTQNSSHSWYVKKPKGKLLIVDDYAISDQIAAGKFYTAIMDSVRSSSTFDGQYDVLDIRTQIPPYLSATFYETLKLFPYTLWYADYNNPSLDLASNTVQKYLAIGGKLFFSMQFPVSVDLNQIQGFLPILSDSSSYRTSIFSGTKISAANNDASYPILSASTSIPRIRTFYPSAGAVPLYYFPNNELKGIMGLRNSEQSLFFIGLPLHLINGTPGSVTSLLKKVFTDFRLIQ